MQNVSHSPYPTPLTCICYKYFWYAVINVSHMYQTEKIHVYSTLTQTTVLCSGQGFSAAHYERQIMKTFQQYSLIQNRDSTRSNIFFFQTDSLELKYLLASVVHVSEFKRGFSSWNVLSTTMDILIGESLFFYHVWCIWGHSHQEDEKWIRQKICQQ